VEETKGQEVTKMKQSLKKLFFAGLSIALLSLPALVWADGFIVPRPPKDVSIQDVPPLSVKYHRVDVEIDNQVATTKIDQVLDDCHHMREWQEKHSGEGTETTHAIIDKRLSTHSRQINMIRGIGTLLAFLGLGNLTDWLGLKK